MKVKANCAVLLFSSAISAVLPAWLARGAELKVRRVLDVSPVWPGQPVGFCLLTVGRRQFAAFYDDQRRMTVAARTIDSRSWRFVRLPERLGWDSHNYVTMTADKEGYLHLAGNMHCTALKYYRTRRPWDIATFQRVEKMVGPRERRCTYPRFFRGPGGRLIFTYRDGSSGNGDQVYNVYQPKTRTWRRLLDTPLTAGRGKMNAYLRGPVAGPDGWWHVCWVWRDTPDCKTNHDLSYARSRDLVHWRTAAGEPVELPMTIKTPGLIVDPVPPGGGIINGNTAIGFDAAGRVIVSYHKFDEAGKTQLYNARLEG
ncbi:MAG: BNR repeat-containing protein, partial [Planctomycetes bacterium]|nr:BNR repeat-containing protein [Planctomycetota bacterium]